MMTATAAVQEDEKEVVSHDDSGGDGVGRQELQQQQQEQNDSPIRPTRAAPVACSNSSSNVVVSQSRAYPFLFTKMRDIHTDTAEFVHYSRRAMRLLVEDAFALLPHDPITITTPCGPCDGIERRKQVNSGSNRTVTAVSIVRSGDCLVEAVREVEPNVKVGKILLQRDEESIDKHPVHYYTKLPPNIHHHHVLLCDPMLATGGSAVAALRVLNNAPYKVPTSSIWFVSLISCPQGLQAVHDAYPDVTIVTAMIDPTLNDDKYIVPGLGDFGDRFYGTS